MATAAAAAAAERAADSAALKLAFDGDDDPGPFVFAHSWMIFFFRSVYEEDLEDEILLFNCFFFNRFLCARSQFKHYLTNKAFKIDLQRFRI